MTRWKELWGALDTRQKAACLAGVSALLYAGVKAAWPAKVARLPPAKAEPWELTTKPAVAQSSSADGNVLRGTTRPGTVGASEPETVPFHVDRVSAVETRALAWEMDVTATTVTWKYASWAEYMAEVRQAARAMIAVGLEPRESVCVLGFNSKEWVIADLACIVAGGFASGIYSTNGAEATRYILEHSKCCICVVEDARQLAKVGSVAAGLPALKACVTYREAAPKWDHETVLLFSWGGFLALGAGPENGPALKERMAQQEAGECATLIYTSGTTGNPKAVMISHDAITWVVRSFAAFARFGKAPGGKERMVSYLPLSHIAAQCIDIYAGLVTVGRSATEPGRLVAERDASGVQNALPLVREVCLYFARPDALKGSLKQTLCSARPTVFFGVPRVWEKFAEALQAVGAKTTGTKKKISTWAKRTALAKYNRSRADSSDATTNVVKGEEDGVVVFEGLLGPLIRTLSEAVALAVLKKVHAAIGLDQAHFAFTGAAPIAVSTLEYFGSLGLVVNEVFGMSEVAGPSAVSLNEYFIPGTCGPALPGVDIRLDHVPGRDKPGEGEVCFRGRSVMMGYLGDEAKTRETIDADGWCHSGDIGALVSTRRHPGCAPFLRITGRVKEMLITAGGENVAPVPIEDALKSLLPPISAAVVVGDKLKFLAVLFTLKQKANDATGSFDDVLVGAAATLNPAVTSARDAALDSDWRQACQAAIDHYNRHLATSQAQKLQKFAILPLDFSQTTGELTPTLKLKRSVVLDKYAHFLTKIYGSDQMKSAVWS